MRGERSRQESHCSLGLSPSSLSNVYGTRQAKVQATQVMVVSARANYQVLLYCSLRDIQNEVCMMIYTHNLGLQLLLTGSRSPSAPI
jgi:hypothetical protein